MNSQVERAAGQGPEGSQGRAPEGSEPSSQRELSMLSEPRVRGSVEVP